MGKAQQFNFNSQLTWSQDKKWLLTYEDSMNMMYIRKYDTEKMKININITTNMINHNAKSFVYEFKDYLIFSSHTNLFTYNIDTDIAPIKMEPPISKDL